MDRVVPFFVIICLAWKLVQAEITNYHVIFSAECTPYMDWQSVGLYHSWKKSGQPGKFTRLLSCSKESLKDYKWLNIMPTHVHPPMNTHHKGDWYPPYNLPGSVLHWVTHNASDSANSEWVIKLDGDMVLRKPLTVEELNVQKGNPIGAMYGYLIGAHNGMADMFMDKEHQAFLSKVGGWELMHIDDLRTIAPLWLEYTEKVREYPPCWNISGDAYVSLANPKPWISEMYGFIFSLALSKIKMREDGDHMIYPGYTPWSTTSADANVLHYGLQLKVGDYEWDKHAWSHTDMLACPGKTFPLPPTVESLKGTPHEPKTKSIQRGYEISYECLSMLNEALEAHHKRYCKNWRKASNADDPKVSIRGVVPSPNANKAWRVYGSVKSKQTTHVLIFKSVSAGAHQGPCAETSVITDAGTEEMTYETYIPAGEAPCFLKDGDRIAFRLRTRIRDDKGAEIGKPVDKDVPEWAQGIFAAGMQQQVPLELLAVRAPDPISTAPKVEDNDNEMPRVDVMYSEDVMPEVRRNAIQTSTEGSVEEEADEEDEEEPEEESAPMSKWWVLMRLLALGLLWGGVVASFLLSMSGKGGMRRSGSRRGVKARSG